MNLTELYFLNTYNRLPIDIDYGSGSYLITKDGEKYLDLFGGLAVNALGYAHPGVVEAVSKQIGRFGHLSNMFLTDVQVEMASLLINYSGMDKLFFTNSGTETAEAAIKLIRAVKGSDKMIFSLSGGFHGRTYGGLSLTHKEKYQKGFEPLLPKTGMIRYNDIDDLVEKVDENTAAIFLEFIQGEGGIYSVTGEFVAKLEELRKKFGFLVVSDCIQCGIGRTGKPFFHDHFNFVPDLILTAKAIGGGLPLGALLVNKEFSEVLTPGRHGTTFGGNPVSCAAGIIVLKEVFENGLMEKVVEKGEFVIKRMEELQKQFPEKIKEVRGKGLMIGIELTFPGAGIVKEMLKRKFLVNCTNEKVIRLLPPLIITTEELQQFVNAFSEVISLA
ncbi:aspartate aminotransferase family protein [Ignavibacteriales bacterium]